MSTYVRNRTAVIPQANKIQGPGHARLPDLNGISSEAALAA